MQITSVLAKNLSNESFLLGKQKNIAISMCKNENLSQNFVSGIYYKQFSLSFGNSVYSDKVDTDDLKTHEMIYKLDNATFGDMISFPNALAFMNFNQKEGASVYLVRNKKNAILGYYIFKLVGKDNLCIDTINLLTEYQGKHTGFTSHVFSQADETARKCGAKKLSLYVLPDNKKAINLYKRHGFRLVNLQTDVYDKAVYYMEKVLP